jgi:restriction system protein
MAVNHNSVPRKEDMYNPLLQALRDLGGSGTIDEIAEHVITALGVPDDVASLFHNPETSNQIELEYRLAWARTYLKLYGLLERSGRGVWSIRADKQVVERVDPLEVNRVVKVLTRPSQDGIPETDVDAATEEEDPEAPDATWRQTLLGSTERASPAWPVF